MSVKRITQTITKRISCFYIVVFLLLFVFQTITGAITIDELADICKKMESSIVDISIEYEWYNDTPLTLEEQLKDANEKGYLLGIGPVSHKLLAARSPSGRDSNSPVFDRYYFETSMTFMDKNENIWDGGTKISYDGKVTKHLSIDKLQQSSVINGTIDSGKEFKNYMLSINLTPLGFSIFSQGIRGPDDKLLLADILKNKKEFIRLDNTITKVNGFNTICASLLTENEPNKQIVYCRIYFSVEHGCTPVRYEFEAGERIAFALDVQSLEQIAEGLWFPSSGIISSPGKQDKNVYKATGKIVANQGLADKDFDIKFPADTRVYDKINDRSYVVTLTEK